MNNVIAADATIKTRLAKTYLVGVCVEIEDIDTFRNEYFKIISDFCNKFAIDYCHPVIKSEDITIHIPSFNFRDARANLTHSLVKINGIKNIHVSFAYHPTKVKIYNNIQINGIDFLTNHLFNYFPLVSVWSYLNHGGNRKYIDKNVKLKMDGINGKITKSWKDVGSHFNNISIIPKGDLIYPEISFTDLVSNYIANTLPIKELFDDKNLDAIIYPIRDVTNVYVTYDIIDAECDDKIVPDFPYEIKPEKFYPHPIYYIHNGSNIGNNLIINSHFHNVVRKKAFENKGCTKFMDLNRDSAILNDGDKIIYLSKESLEDLEMIKSIYPNKDIEILDTKSFLES